MTPTKYECAVLVIAGNWRAIAKTPIPWAFRRSRPTKYECPVLVATKYESCEFAFCKTIVKILRRDQTKTLERNWDKIAKIPPYIFFITYPQIRSACARARSRTGGIPAGTIASGSVGQLSGAIAQSGCRRAEIRLCPREFSLRSPLQKTGWGKYKTCPGEDLFRRHEISCGGWRALWRA